MLESLSKLLSLNGLQGPEYGILYRYKYIYSTCTGFS